MFLYKEQNQLDREKEEFKHKRPQEVQRVDFEESVGLNSKSDCKLSEAQLKAFNYMFEQSPEFKGISKYIYRGSLYRGVRFGELGIVNKMPRSATIIANVRAAHAGKLLPGLPGLSRGQ